MVSYFDETLQALFFGNIYVSPEAAATTPVDKSALKQEISDRQIAVVVLPESASQEVTSLPNFARDIVESTNYTTVLVVVGNDYDAVSGVLPPGKASEIANRVETDYTSIDDATQQFVSEVNAQLQTPAEPEGISSVGIIRGSVALVVIVVLSAIGIRFLRKQKRLSLSVVRRTLSDISALPEKIQDEALAASIRTCVSNIEQLIVDIENSPEAVMTFRSVYEKELVDYHRHILSTYLVVQDDRARVIYSEKNRERVEASARSNTKSLSDSAVRQHRAIKNDSLTAFHNTADRLDMQFPENILNER